jgi:hypothetical protein
MTRPAGTYKNADPTCVQPCLGWFDGVISQTLSPDSYWPPDDTRDYLDSMGETYPFIPRSPVNKCSNGRHPDPIPSTLLKPKKCTSALLPTITTIIYLSLARFWDFP